jgi:hypothetical protein
MDSLLTTVDNLLTLSSSANKDAIPNNSMNRSTSTMTRLGSSLNLSGKQGSKNTNIVAAPSVDINAGDYDKRTALHVAASQGHAHVVEFLCLKGANVNIEDKQGNRPLDDAIRFKHDACIEILKKCGALPSEQLIQHQESTGLKNRIESTEADESPLIDQDDNLRVEFTDLEMIDKIGSGAFGEIFKCRWRGTLVAAKCIKSAKIVSMWKKDLGGSDKTPADHDKDNAHAMTDDEMITALEDFRQETMILRSLRHPHIVMLLAYSTTQNYEVMISELMKCSLWDVL